MSHAKVKQASEQILSILSPESQEIVYLFIRDIPPSKIAEVRHISLRHVRNVCEGFYTLMLARTV